MGFDLSPLSCRGFPGENIVQRTISLPAADPNITIETWVLDLVVITPGGSVVL